MSVKMTTAKPKAPTTTNMEEWQKINRKNSAMDSDTPVIAAPNMTAPVTSGVNPVTGASTAAASPATAIDWSKYTFTEGDRQAWAGATMADRQAAKADEAYRGRYLWDERRREIYSSADPAKRTDMDNMLLLLNERRAQNEARARALQDLADVSARRTFAQAASATESDTLYRQYLREQGYDPVYGYTRKVGTNDYLTTTEGYVNWLRNMGLAIPTTVPAQYRPTRSVSSDIQPTVPVATNNETTNVPLRTARPVGDEIQPTVPVAAEGADTVVNGSSMPPATTGKETTPAIDPDYAAWLKKKGYDTEADYNESLQAIDNSYQRALSSYGAAAENMAQAGLTNSGYSDHLDASAYAARVAAEQDALDTKQAVDKANLAEYNAHLEEQSAKADAALLALKQNGINSMSQNAVRAEYGEEAFNNAMERYNAYVGTEDFIKDNQATISGIVSDLVSAGGVNMIDTNTKNAAIAQYGQGVWDAAVKQYEQNRTEMGSSLVDVATGTGDLDAFLTSNDYDISTMDDDAKNAAMEHAADEWYKSLGENVTAEQQQQYDDFYINLTQSYLSDIAEYGVNDALDKIYSVVSGSNEKKNLSSNATKNIIEQIDQVLPFSIEKQGRAQYNIEFAINGRKVKEICSLEYQPYEGYEPYDEKSLADYATTSYLYSTEMMDPSITMATYKNDKYIKEDGKWYVVYDYGMGRETKAWDIYCEIQKLRAKRKEG